MLSVSFSLALVAAMLFGIVLPSHHKEVDKFNGQTRRPIPAGYKEMVIGLQQFKVAGRPRFIFFRSTELRGGARLTRQPRIRFERCRSVWASAQIL